MGQFQVKLLKAFVLNKISVQISKNIRFLRYGLYLVVIDKQSDYAIMENEQFRFLSRMRENIGD